MRMRMRIIEAHVKKDPCILCVSGNGKWEMGDESLPYAGILRLGAFALMTM